MKRKDKAGTWGGRTHGAAPTGGIETIKTHIQRIFRKLDVKNRMEAVAVAREKKII